MAINLNVIRNITVRGTTQGVDETTAKLNKLAGAQENVAQVSERSARSQLSVERALERIQRQFDASYRSAQQFAKVQSDLERARAQGLISQQRQAELLAMAATRYDQVTRGQRAFIAASQAANDNIRTLASSAGALGSTLAALGPAGVAAAAGFGALALALHQVVVSSLEFADKAGKLVDFAQTTGFTTDALQALNKVASQVGLTSDQVGSNIERFAAQFGELRRGTGQLYEQLLEVNPALARQMAEATSVAKAFDLYNKAVAQANDLDRVRLARAAFGRSGAGMVRLSTAIDEQGGLAGIVQGFSEADRRSKELLQRVDDLGDRITYNSAKAKENIVSIFAEDVLRGVDAWTQRLLTASQTLVTMKSTISADDWSRWVTILQTAASAIPGLNAIIALYNTVTSAGGTQAAPSPQRRGVADATDRDAEAARLRRVTEDREADTASIILNYNEMQRWVSAIGSAATPAQQLELRQRGLSAAHAEGKISAEQLARAQGLLNAEYRADRLQANVAAMGSAATVAEQYAASVARLTLQYQKGEVSQEAFRRGLGALKSDMGLQAKRDAVSALGEAATETEKYELRVAELQRELDRGAISQDTFNRAVAAANPIFQKLTDVSGQFLTNFLQGLGQGKSLVESLTGSLKSMGSQLINIGSQGINAGLGSLFSGGGLSGFASAGGVQGLAFAGIGLGISGIINNMQRRQQRQQDILQAQQETRQRIADMQARTQLIGIDTSTREGALRAFDLETQQNPLLGKLSKGQGTGETQAFLEMRAAERLALIKRFNDQEIEEEKRRQSELKKLRMDFADREFAAMNDTSTLQGQLLAFDRAAARERLELGEEFASLMPNLERAQAAERLAIIRDFNEQAAEETRQFFDAFRKNIDAYLVNLRTGQASPLSPADRFSEAQARFNAQLAIGSAAGPNQRAALEGITQDADRLLEAARALYGSSSGFQSIFTSVTSQLEALPDIAELADPIVAAIQAQTTALTTPLVNIKSSTDTVATNTDQTADNVGDNNSTGLRGLTTSQNAILNSIDSLSGAIRSNTKVATEQSGLLDAIFENTREGWAPNGQWARGANRNPSPKQGFELGGLAMPGQSIIYGEHHPRGPFFATVGPDPIAITPGMPPQFAGNDNAAAAEIRALRAEVRELREELARNTRVTAAGAEHVGGQVAEVAGGVNELVRETKFAGQKKSKAA